MVPVVDQLIWVLDPQKYADAAVHHGYLRPLSRHSEVIVVVLNQVDRLAERDVPRVVSSLERILTEDGLTEVTVLPASAVPVSVGVLSPVVVPLAGASTTGAGGGVVSTMNVLVAESGLVLPTESVARASTVCTPSESTVVGVKLQSPLADTVTVEVSTFPSTMRVTVLPGSAVPL